MMRDSIISVVVIVLAVISMLAGPAYCDQEKDMEWTFDSQRPEIAPKHWQDSEIKYQDQPTLALAGDGQFHANGCWVKTVGVTQEKWYRFKVFFKAERVEELYRSVLARVIWLDENAKALSRPEYPRTMDSNGDSWRTIQWDFHAPEKAVKARLELIYRWDADGQVNFAPASLTPTDPPKPRPVGLATVFYKPKGPTAQDNINQFAELIGQAVDRGADIVCLPEGATMYGTGRTYIQCAEPIPGPSTEQLGKVAAKHNVYIVAGLLESDGPAVYNTSVLIDRNGKLVGSYRKVSLPREEIEGGVTPGKNFPTFETDFGRVGMMICWDNQFPEPARQLAMAGAEVILMPIWGGSETLTKARAIENQAYIVSCTYGSTSAVFGLDGGILAQATVHQPVAVAKVDLAEVQMWPWVGDFAGRLRREMPPRSATIPDELK